MGLSSGEPRHAQAARRALKAYHTRVATGSEQATRVSTSGDYMKYKTLFRLAVKAIGVYMLATGISGLAYICTSAFLVWPARGTVDWAQWMIWPVSDVVEVALGVYLFLGGRWIANLAIPSNRPHCHECGYELRGLPAAGMCPECGTEYRLPESRSASRST